MNHEQEVVVSFSREILDGIMGLARFQRHKTVTTIEP